MTTFGTKEYRVFHHICLQPAALLSSWPGPQLDTSEFMYIISLRPLPTLTSVKPSVVSVSEAGHHAVQAAEWRHCSTTRRRPTHTTCTNAPIGYLKPILSTLTSSTRDIQKPIMQYTFMILSF